MYFLCRQLNHPSVRHFGISFPPPLAKPSEHWVSIIHNKWESGKNVKESFNYFPIMRIKKIRSRMKICTKYTRHRESVYYLRLFTATHTVCISTMILKLKRDRVAPVGKLILFFSGERRPFMWIYAEIMPAVVSLDICMHECAYIMHSYCQASNIDFQTIASPLYSSTSFLFPFVVIIVINLIQRSSWIKWLIHAL